MFDLSVSLSLPPEDSGANSLANEHWVGVQGEVLFSLYSRVPHSLYSNWHVGSDILGCEAYAET